MESYKEDGRPSFQFYPKDWLSSVNDVRLCSLEARGLWIDLLCIMFFSPIRGALLNSNGIQMSYKDLTKITGASERKIESLLEELDNNGTLSTLEDGTIVNRRMYKEEQHKERISNIRRQAVGKRWGYKNNTKHTASSPSSPSSSTSTSKKETLLVPDTKHLELVELLKSLMLKNNPTVKITLAQTKCWCNDVRLMVEQDDRTLPEIQRLIIWSQNDSFWKGNILSMGKLRGQFDQLTMKAKTDNQYLTKAQRGNIASMERFEKKRKAEGKL